MTELNEELLDKVTGGNGNNASKPKIGNDCVSCGYCLDLCPMEAITENHEVYTINPELCNCCNKCVEECPTQTIGY